LKFRNSTVWVVDIAKNNRIGRARLLTCRLQIAVFDRAVGAFSIDAVLVDPLNAVGALLHHATAADAHIRVAHHLVLRRLPILEKQEVEATYLVRTVIRAVSSADTAVVDHVV